MELKDLISIFQPLNEALRNRILKLVGKKILYTVLAMLNIHMNYLDMDGIQSIFQMKFQN